MQACSSAPSAMCTRTTPGRRRAGRAPRSSGPVPWHDRRLRPRWAAPHRFPAQPVDPSPQASTQIPADLGRRTARGAGITLAGQGARILLQLLSVMVLARLLVPSDYGLLAVGLVVVGIGEVVRDFGLTAAAVRAPELTIQQRNGLFWINSGAGVLLALLAVASAGPIA